MKQIYFYYKMFTGLLLIVMLFNGCNNTTEIQEDKQEEIQNININELSNSMETTLEQMIVTTETPVTKNGLNLKILGVALYDYLESEDYKDEPKKGNKYLVVFLDIKNTTGIDDYFNYNYLTAKLDGNIIEDTFLLNLPENYDSIKTELPNDLITQGYLAWEVPENWEKLEITYTGWAENFYLEPTIIIKPEDLKVPEKYSDYNRI